MGKKKVKTSLILVFYLLIVILAKVVRYTVMKESLIDYTQGFGWLESMNRGANSFVFSITDGSGVATINSMALFQIFRFFGLSTFYDYEILISILWNLILILIILKLKPRVTIYEFLFLAMAIAVLNIWDFCLSKEPLQMVFFVIIFMILSSKKIKDKSKFSLSLLVILFSCFVYRNYYIAMIAFAIANYVFIDKMIIKKSKVSYKDILLLLLLYGVLFALIVSVSQVLAPDIYEQLTYLNTSETAARTDMSGIFNSSNLILSSLDYIILIIRMLLPVELIRFGPKYWLYIIYQFLITAFFIRTVLKIKTNSKTVNYAIYLFLGYLLVSALFEPDFGSWVRHEATTLPLLVIAMGLLKEGEKEDESIGY